MTRRFHLPECGSTNDEAWNLPANQWPALVSTDSQTRGRGRQGRAWVQAPQKPGSQIFASLVFKPRIRSPSELNWMPLSAGVAAMHALQRIVGQAASDPIRLKWPNDIQLAGRKLSGILCESRFQGTELLGIVIGIGLNVTAAPVLADQRAAALNETAPGIDASSFREEFLGAWADRLAQPLDPEKTRADWVRFARLETHPAFQVRGEGKTKYDVQALDLSEDGRLQVRFLTGERAGALAFLNQADSL